MVRKRQAEAPVPDRPTEVPVATSNDEQRPCKSFTCAVGNGSVIEAAIWAKETRLNDQSLVVYSVRVQKNYQAGEEWHSTAQFRGSEIHIAIHVLQLAERWILQQRTQEEPPL